MKDPETPQEQYESDVVRHRDLYFLSLHEDGERLVGIARRTRLSNSRVSQIIARAKKWELYR